MPVLIKSPKEFWAGLIYIGLAAAAIMIGWDYRIGTAGRMGPGYFPLAISGLLLLVGVASLIRAFVLKGDGLGDIAWKPMFFILLACALFGWLLPRAGIVVALLALCLVSAAASREFRFELKATLGLVALVIFCVLVFVKGLGVPLPMWGTWLEPFAANLPAWAR